MEIELLVVTDCPHEKRAIRALRHVMTHAGQVETPVTLTVIHTLEQAQERAFPGSPTLLLNGRDPFPTSGEPALACRLYDKPGGLAGELDVAMITAALNEAASREHWEGVYAKDTRQLSWHQTTAGTSHSLLARFAPPPAAVLDVGAGAGVLVDELLAGGWQDITLLDISTHALEAVASRLSTDRRVTFVAADLVTWLPPRQFDAWHDRAVFHFLTEDQDRQRYQQLAATALRPGGVLLLATFAPDGPQRCSGLPTSRYSAGDLAALFAADFTLLHSDHENHQTPGGLTQPFTWVAMRRR